MTTDTFNPITTLSFMVPVSCRFVPDRKDPASWNFFLPTQVVGNLWRYARDFVPREERVRVQRAIGEKGNKILQAITESGLLPEHAHLPEYWEASGPREIGTAPVRVLVSDPFTVVHHFPAGDEENMPVRLSCVLRIMCQLSEPMGDKLLFLMQSLAKTEGIDLPSDITEAVFTWNKPVSRGWTGKRMRTVVSARFQNGLALFGADRTPRTSFMALGHRYIPPQFLGVRDMGVFLLHPSVRDPGLFHALPGNVLACLPGLSPEDVPLEKTPDEWTAEEKGRVTMTLLSNGREHGER